MAELTCPHCRELLQVATAPEAGRRVRCYLCKEIFVVGETARKTINPTSRPPAAPRPAAAHAPYPLSDVASAPLQQVPLPPSLNSHSSETPRWVMWLTVSIGGGAALLLIILFSLKTVQSFAKSAPKSPLISVSSPTQVSEPKAAAIPPPSFAPAPPSTTAAPNIVPSPFAPPPSVVVPPAAPPSATAGPPLAPVAAAENAPAVVASEPSAANAAPASAAAASEVEPPRPSEPETTYVADRELAYGWKVGRKYQYMVDVEFGSASFFDRCGGMIEYQRAPGIPSQAVDLLRGLTSRWGLADPRQAHLLEVNGSLHFGHNNSANLTADLLQSPRGDTAVRHGDVFLPGLMTSYALVAVDKLPRKGESAWEATLSTDVQYERPVGEGLAGSFAVGGPLYGYGPGQKIEVTKAVKVDRWRYRLGVREGKLQTIHKSHVAETRALTDSRVIGTAIGEGVIRFDLENNVPFDSRMEYVTQQKIDGVEYRRAAVFSYEQWDPVEAARKREEIRKRGEELARESAAFMAKMEQERIEKSERRAREARERTEAFQREQIEKTTAKSDEIRRRLARLQTAGITAEEARQSFAFLNSYPPVDLLRDDIQAATLAWLDSPDPEYRKQALFLGYKWGVTKKHLPGLLRVLPAPGNGMGHYVYDMIARFPESPEAVEGLVQCLTNPGGGYDVAQALKKMGSATEDALLRIAEQETNPVTLRYCIDILETVGTRKSLPFLTKLAQDPQAKFAAERAAERVQARLRGK